MGCNKTKMTCPQISLAPCISSSFQWWHCFGFIVSITFLNLSHTSLVGVLEFSRFTILFHVSFLAFLNTLCLMALLYWNGFKLVLFVGSRRCFLYSSFTILSSLSHSLFHHATGGLLFTFVDVLGMVFLLILLYLFFGHVLLRLCFGPVKLFLFGFLS